MKTSHKYDLQFFLAVFQDLTYNDLMIINGFIDTIIFQLHGGCPSRLQTNHPVDKSTHMTAFFRDSLFIVVFLMKTIDSDTSRAQLKYFQGWVGTKSSQATFIEYETCANTLS